MRMNTVLQIEFDCSNIIQDISFSDIFFFLIENENWLRKKRMKSESKMETMNKTQICIFQNIIWLCALSEARFVWEPTIFITFNLVSIELLKRYSAICSL